MAVVVSDTSPIRALGHLGLIDLLRELYGEVLLPPAVDAELRNPAAGLLRVRKVMSASKFRRVGTAHHALTERLVGGAHPTKTVTQAGHYFPDPR